MQSNSRKLALGGMLAAVAVVIMCLGGFIPIATYVCPMLCCVTQFIVFRLCGRRLAWTWYCAVVILSLFFGPDKEAVAVFAFLGYYPILKPRIDTLPAKWLCKGILFNAAILTMYWLLIHLIGMVQLSEEFTELGIVTTAVMLVLGNVIFFMLDKVLDMCEKMSRR